MKGERGTQSAVEHLEVEEIVDAGKILRIVDVLEIELRRELMAFDTASHSWRSHRAAPSRATERCFADRPTHASRRLRRRRRATEAIVAEVVNGENFARMARHIVEVVIQQSARYAENVAIQSPKGVQAVHRIVRYDLRVDIGVIGDDGSSDR